MAKLTLPANELNEFDLPRICAITGATDGVVFKEVKFQWYPRWIVALVLINLLIAAIVAMAMTKKVKGKLPFTEESYAAWRRGRLLYGLSIFGAFVLFIGAMIAFASDSVVLGLLGLVATIAIPVAVYFTQVKGKTIGCTRISDGTIELTLPSEQVVLAFQQHLHAGASAPAIAAPVA